MIKITKSLLQTSRYYQFVIVHNIRILFPENFIKMENKRNDQIENTTVSPIELQHDHFIDQSDVVSDEPPKKIFKSDLNLPFKKKNFALLLAYSGKNYYGMQINKGFKTIEGELLDAMLKSGVVLEEHVTKNSMRFQRAARTDKGVSAIANVVNGKIYVENPVEKINNNLSQDIRVLAMRRVTKGFSCKNSCDSRTYTYLIPTYAFKSKDDDESFDPLTFRITSEMHEEINKVLSHFVGVHNFHNFTSGKKFRDPSAKRNILAFKMLEPFVSNEMQFAEIQVKGQSFMLHHIRKMIGLTLVIIKGYIGTEIIDDCWKAEKVDVPKAPGLGLLLSTLHYDVYNKRYGSTHESLDWDEFKDQIEDFKISRIYPTIIETEVNEKPMLQWLNTLHCHNFEPKTYENTEKTSTELTH